MPRQAGARNAKYEERRGALIAKLRERLGRPGATPASWRELAAAAEVSLSTLSHYFGRREDVVRAIMEDDRIGGAAPLAIMSQPSGPFARSIPDALDHIADGFRFGGLDTMFATGLIEGLGHDTIGPAFLASALEPTLAAVEHRLRMHIERGEMCDVDVRVPALVLIAPVVLAFLHQRQLGGAAVRPLEMATFLSEHAEAFVRAWRA